MGFKTCDPVEYGLSNLQKNISTKISAFASGLSREARAWTGPRLNDEWLNSMFSKLVNQCFCILGEAHNPPTSLVSR